MMAKPMKTLELQYPMIQFFKDLAKPKSGTPDHKQLTWLESAIQWKASTRAAVNFKKAHDPC